MDDSTMKQAFQGTLAIGALLLSVLAAQGCAATDREQVASVTAALTLPLGQLERVTRLNIHGWACSPSSRSSPINVYCTDGSTAIRSASANWRREQFIGWQCGQNVAHGFQFPTPYSLLDGANRQISVYYDAAHTQPIASSPFSFN